MLRYLSSGLRPFGDHPMAPHRRVNWEFYAVLEGRLAMQRAGAAELYQRDTLWVLPPTLDHGWRGEAGRECEVVVFHFDCVPVALERSVQPEGYLAVHLAEADKEGLRRLAGALVPHYRQPCSRSELHFDRALIELSLLALENPPSAGGEMAATGGGAAAREGEVEAEGLKLAALAKVLAAEKWFVEHLAAHPSLADVARAGGVSGSHLRRLFYQVRGESPRAVFESLRMRQAMSLLAGSDEKLAAVAAECGFVDASQLCQLFRHRIGTTPTHWRRHLYEQYRRPEAGADDLLRAEEAERDGEPELAGATDGPGG